MASTLAVLLLLSAGLFTVKAVLSGLGETCKSYTTISGDHKPGFTCVLQHCCGDCDNRFCCSSEHLKFTKSVESFCDVRNGALIIVLIILGVGFHIGLIVVCCCCPCCCIYKMCRKPRPVAGVNVTTVATTQLVQQQQPVMQCPQYQPVPTHPGYSQPMQTGPYQEQPYAPGPPPSYHMAKSPGYPTSQSAYDEGQEMYPMQPPAQPGVAYMPSETSTQPAYNPAYM